MTSNNNSGARATARVVCQERDAYRIELSQAPNTNLLAKLRGKMRLESVNPSDLPVVGDLVEVTVEPGLALIERVLPRKSLLRRKAAGADHEQPIAANIDFVLIATSINHDFSLNRIERYLSIAWDSGAQPVVLLTKRDLDEHWQEKCKEAEARFMAVPVHALSVHNQESLGVIEAYFAAGKQSVIVGSSGVGKSTLINHLIGAPTLVVQDVRESDSKGRHTTTSRSLWATRFGGSVIDTPGMRELQLLDQSQGVSEVFKDIEELAAKCRFTDCQHQNEPDCAVQAALASGALDGQRLKSFNKLRREAAFEARKTDVRLRIETQRKWRKMGALGRERSRAKRSGNGF
jgi:ribosome biogenesis GTPase